ncbi:hypothetical protein [Methanosarcina sp.]|nr:hypothetical protein [Methanosarcina sp.]HOW14362.1 hypothetical protein [Methanosarcina sp.]
MELENSKKYENTAGFMAANLQWRAINLSGLYRKTPLKKLKKK